MISLCNEKQSKHCPQQLLCLVTVLVVLLSNSHLSVLGYPTVEPPTCAIPPTSGYRVSTDNVFLSKIVTECDEALGCVSDTCSCIGGSYDFVANKCDMDLATRPAPTEQQCQDVQGCFVKGQECLIKNATVKSLESPSDLLCRQWALLIYVETTELESGSRFNTTSTYTSCGEYGCLLSNLTGCPHKNTFRCEVPINSVFTGNLTISGSRWGLMLSNASLRATIKTTLENSLSKRLGHLVTVTDLREGSLVVSFEVATTSTSTEVGDSVRSLQTTANSTSADMAWMASLQTLYMEETGSAEILGILTATPSGDSLVTIPPTSSPANSTPVPSTPNPTTLDETPTPTDAPASENPGCTTGCIFLIVVGTLGVVSIIASSCLIYAYCMKRGDVRRKAFNSPARHGLYDMRTPEGGKKQGQQQQQQQQQQDQSTQRQRKFNNGPSSSSSIGQQGTPNAYSGASNPYYNTSSPFPIQQQSTSLPRYDTQRNYGSPKGYKTVDDAL